MQWVLEKKAAAAVGSAPQRTPARNKKPPAGGKSEWIYKPSSVIEGNHLSRPAVADRLKPPVG